MKQDRQGDGGNEASGGRGSRKTQHSRVRQARCRSLPATSCAVGARNLRRGESTRLRGFGRCKANGRSGSGQDSGAERSPREESPKTSLFLTTWDAREDLGDQPREG
jgi:hypothetical protein